MTISFTVDEEHPAFVRLACRGVYTRDALLSVFLQGIDGAASRNRRAVLVDIRGVEGTPPGIFERYELGVGAARTQREKTPLIIIAVVGDEPMIDPKRLGEIVFLNRGGIGKVFTEVDEAIAWLETRVE